MHGVYIGGMRPRVSPKPPKKLYGLEYCINAHSRPDGEDWP
jgi:hypothetical protein